jgi:hypothetical protein
MAVIKYNLNEQDYIDAKAYLKEIEGAYELSHDQLIRLHQMSTRLGHASSPGGCSACNRRALTIINGYVHEYERIVINGEGE